MTVIPFTECDKYCTDSFLSQAMAAPSRRLWRRFWRRVSRASRHEQRDWRGYCGYQDGAAWPRRAAR